MSSHHPRELPYTGDAAADALLAEDPLALLVGLVLDQQVSVQKAFSGPYELRRRIGTLDAATIAAFDPAELEQVFKARPALHRFPGNMARLTQALCAAIAESYGGDAGRIWAEASDGPDLEARLLALPGIGDMKAKALIAILGKRFGVELPDMDAVMPAYPTLGDVDSAEALAHYQEQKRAHKQHLRAPGAASHPARVGR